MSAHAPFSILARKESDKNNPRGCLAAGGWQRLPFSLMNPLPNWRRNSGSVVLLRNRRMALRRPAPCGCRNSESKLELGLITRMIQEPLLWPQRYSQCSRCRSPLFFILRELLLEHLAMCCYSLQFWQWHCKLRGDLQLTPELRCYTAGLYTKPPAMSFLLLATAVEPTFLWSCSLSCSVPCRGSRLLGVAFVRFTSRGCC